MAKKQNPYLDRTPLLICRNCGQVQADHGTEQLCADGRSAFQPATGLYAVALQ